MLQSRGQRTFGFHLLSGSIIKGCMYAMHFSFLNNMKIKAVGRVPRETTMGASDAKELTHDACA